MKLIITRVVDITKRPPYEIAIYCNFEFIFLFKLPCGMSLIFSQPAIVISLEVWQRVVWFYELVLSSEAFVLLHEFLMIWLPHVALILFLKVINNNKRSYLSSLSSLHLPIPGHQLLDIPNMLLQCSTGRGTEWLVLED